MSDQEAPRVFITYSQESAEHKKQVLQFAEFLRTRVGLDVHLDRWYDSRRLDWSTWATEQLKRADYIIVMASAAYRRRADGEAPPHEGRGAQFEAAIIRNFLTKDLAAATEKILPVVLSGQSIDDIPTFLNAYSTTRYHVEELTEEGVADLLAAITGNGAHPMPTRGVWRGGSVDPRTHQPVLLAHLPWLAQSRGLEPGGAWIDGVHYGDSVIVRGSPLATGTRSFVEVDLGRSYRQLTSVVGVLDDAVEAFQTGHFLAYLDGTLRQEISVTLGKPGEVEIDVAGVRHLRLEMHRPAAGLPHTPRRVGPTVRSSGRPPELAWGNPTLL